MVGKDRIDEDTDPELTINRTTEAYSRTNSRVYGLG